MTGAPCSDAPGSLTVHASAIAIGGRAILITGPSKSGKSHLALALLGLSGAPAVKLIGDDRVILSRRGGDMSVSPHPLIAGLIEKRGYGFLAMPYVAGVPLEGAVRLQYVRSGIEPGPGPREQREPELESGVPFLVLPRETPWDLRAQAVLKWYTAALTAHTAEKPRMRDLKSTKD